MSQADLLAPATPPARVTTDKVREMMRKRYPAPEWALLEEVAPKNGGGYGYTDAVAIGLYQSRGHAVHGFEYKVSRGDWLKELKSPGKAEAVFSYCDRWWLVAAKGIVWPGELPATWGLIEATPATLRVSIEAPKLQPKPLSREFFASLVRRAHEGIERRAAGMVSDALADSQRMLEERVQQRVKDRSRELTRLEERLAEFHKATGLEISPWAGPPIATIKVAQRLEGLSGYARDQMFGRLAEAAAEMERVAKLLRQAADPGEG